QGAGNVGSRVVQLLRQEGASVLVSDVDPGRADRVAAMWGAGTARADDLLASRCAVHSPRAHRGAAMWGAQTAGPDDLLAAECDVLCPCAHGGVITERSARALRCGVVCGGANNILEHAGLEDLLRARGITYVPET